MREVKCAGLAICMFTILCLGFSPFTFGQARSIEMTYSTHMPARHTVTLMSIDWAREVEKATNGRVKATVFAGGTMLAADEALKYCLAEPRKIQQ